MKCKTNYNKLCYSIKSQIICDLLHINEKENVI
jgi:hypothetical protein